jgi:hypothetical protein
MTPKKKQVNLFLLQAGIPQWLAYVTSIPGPFRESNFHLARSGILEIRNELTRTIALTELGQFMDCFLNSHYAVQIYISSKHSVGNIFMDSVKITEDGE